MALTAKAKQKKVAKKAAKRKAQLKGKKQTSLLNTAKKSEITRMADQHDHGHGHGHEHHHHHEGCNHDH